MVDTSSIGARQLVILVRPPARRSSTRHTDRSQDPTPILPACAVDQPPRPTSSALTGYPTLRPPTPAGASGRAQASGTRNACCGVTGARARGCLGGLAPGCRGEGSSSCAGAQLELVGAQQGALFARRPHRRMALWPIRLGYCTISSCEYGERVLSYRLSPKLPRVAAVATALVALVPPIAATPDAAAAVAAAAAAAAITGVRTWAPPTGPGLVPHRRTGRSSPAPHAARGQSARGEPRRPLPNRCCSLKFFPCPPPAWEASLDVSRG
jgi:hypothetical protein